MSVFAAMLRRRVFMRRNSYFKNRAIYDLSMADEANVTFVPEPAAETPGSVSSKSRKKRAPAAADATPATRTVTEEELVALARLRREYFEPELMRLQAVIGDFEKLKAEWYEPELRRLGLVEAEHHKLSAAFARLGPRGSADSEIHVLRRRVMHHAGQARELADEIAALKRQLAEAENAPGLRAKRNRPGFFKRLERSIRKRRKKLQARWRNDGTGSSQT